MYVQWTDVEGIVRWIYQWLVHQINKKNYIYSYHGIFYIYFCMTPISVINPIKYGNNICRFLLRDLRHIHRDMKKCIEIYPCCFGSTSFITITRTVICSIKYALGFLGFGVAIPISYVINVIVQFIHLLLFLWLFSWQSAITWYPNSPWNNPEGRS